MRVSERKKIERKIAAVLGYRYAKVTEHPEAPTNDAEREAWLAARQARRQELESLRDAGSHAGLRRVFVRLLEAVCSAVDVDFHPASLGPLKEALAAADALEALVDRHYELSVLVAADRRHHHSHRFESWVSNDGCGWHDCCCGDSPDALLAAAEARAAAWPEAVRIRSKIHQNSE